MSSGLIQMEEKESIEHNSSRSSGRRNSMTQFPKDGLLHALPAPEIPRTTNVGVSEAFEAPPPYRSIEEQAQLSKVFQKSVRHVVNEKRMWNDLWNALDKAEETDLMSRFSGKEELLASLSKEVSLPVKIPKPPKSSYINSSQVEQQKRRQSYIRKADEMHIHTQDIYHPESYPNVPPQFLWEVTRNQDFIRKKLLEDVSSKSEYIEANIQLDDTTPITGEWIEVLLEELKKERIIPYNVAYQIARRAIASCLPLDNVVSIKLTQQGDKPQDIAVVGDLHGQLDDLLMVFREAGTPWKGQRLLFNGDFVDRGEYSCEVALVLLACRAAFPDYVYLNRGNHEAEDMNSLDGFMAEALRKYDEHIWKIINHAFATLPIAHLINLPSQRVFVVHAGLSFVNFTFDQVNRENRFLPYFRRNTILQDLLWSDPYTGRGCIHSRRGAGCQFGADVAEQFFRLNKVSLIIRSHECEDHGYKLWFENRLYTIFSASNYCGDTDNYGAYCLLSTASRVPQIRLFVARRQVLKYTERLQRARQSTVTKLLVRLTSCITQVEEILRKTAVLEEYNQDKTTDSVETISLAGWSVALETALGIKIPFRAIASRLGLPGTLSRIPISKWCNKFKLTPKENESSLVHYISVLLYDPVSPFRAALEELFQYFDVNKDGTITPEELKQGLNTLLSKMKDFGGKSITWTDDEMNDLMQKADVNNDGEIDYNEFFRLFTFNQIDLSALEEDLEYL